MISRSDIQAKINELKGIKSPVVKQVAQPIKLTSEQLDTQTVKDGISTWLDTVDLSQDGLTQEFMKDHILADLNSYEGVEDG